MMCGICGSVSNRRTDTIAVKRMNQFLIHRGPDGEGEFFENGISLAMRRLSIIDLKGGWQPLYNEDKTLVLIINGEIYNYIELRINLESKGHVFITRSDGETIIHLYEDYGIKCLDHLRGMFAFALWDREKKVLYIARDRMGEKPLYFFQNKNLFLFSSELRSLLKYGNLDLQLDPRAIDMFFHYHYIPEPFTPFKSIHKLPAGHYLCIEQETMKVREESYWKIEDSPPLVGNPYEIIREKLEEVSKLVIRADVPVGIALSGGIDSSAISALALKYYKGNMQAFTVGYEGNIESDERKTAKKIADFLKMPLNEIELKDEDFIANFPKICSITDDPIADISAFGYYSISRKANEQKVPVLLQGQGGDELFWGYPWVKNNYQYVLLKNRLRNQQAGFGDYYWLKFREQMTKFTFKKFVKGVLSFREAYNLYQKHKKEGTDIFPFYDYFNGFNWSDLTKSRFYGSFMLDAADSIKVTSPFTVDNAWENTELTLTKLICSTYLLENGITQGDRLSMANSIELRLPLIDYKLVETVIGLRKNYSDIQLPPKTWLNQSIKDLLPTWLFKLKKRGFEPPVERWLNLILKEYGNKLPEGILVDQCIISKNAALKLSKGEIEPRTVFPAYLNAIVFENWMRSLYPV